MTDYSQLRDEIKEKIFINYPLFETYVVLLIGHANSPQKIKNEDLSARINAAINATGFTRLKTETRDASIKMSDEEFNMRIKPYIDSYIRVFLPSSTDSSSSKEGEIPLSSNPSMFKLDTDDIINYILEILNDERGDNTKHIATLKKCLDIILGYTSAKDDEFLGMMLVDLKDETTDLHSFCEGRRGENPDAQMNCTSQICDQIDKDELMERTSCIMGMASNTFSALAGSHDECNNALYFPEFEQENILFTPDNWNKRVSNPAKRAPPGHIILSLSEYPFYNIDPIHSVPQVLTDTKSTPTHYYQVGYYKNSSILGNVGSQIKDSLDFGDAFKDIISGEMGARKVALRTLTINDVNKKACSAKYVQCCSERYIAHSQIKKDGLYHGSSTSSGSYHYLLCEELATFRRLWSRLNLSLEILKERGVDVIKENECMCQELPLVNRCPEGFQNMTQPYQNITEYQDTYYKKSMDWGKRGYIIAISILLFIMFLKIYAF